MAQPVPWNVRGIDPDVREAALLAARRSGMTLGQWLNAVIGDTVSSEGVPQAVAGESAAAADPFAAVTRRIRAFNDRGSSAAMAAAGATRHGDDVARVGEIVGTAIESMERSARERDARTVAALEAMTDLLRRQAVETPRRRWNDAPADAASAEAGLRAGNPVRQMIERIETRLDTLSAETQGPNVEASLRELDRRLVEIARKLEQPSRIVVEPVRDDNIERIEGKLGAILDTLNLKALRDIAREAAEEPSEPIDEIPAAPVAEAPVEAAPTAPASAPSIAGEVPDVPERGPIPAEHIRSVVDDIARRQHDLDAEDEAFADLTAPIEASAPLGDLKRRIEELSARFDRGDGGVASRQIEALHTEIADLSRAIENVAPRHVVVSIEGAIRDLAQRVEQSRDGGVRAAQLAPVEALLLDLRVAVDSLRDTTAIDTLREDLRSFARKLDRSAPADGKGLEAIQLQMADLRQSVLDAREPAALEGLEHRIISLADKLDRLVAAPRAAQASTGLSTAVEEVRASLHDALPTDLIARIEQHVGALGGIDSRLEQIAARMEQGPDRSDFDALHARMDQMQSSLLERPEPAMPALAASADLGAIEGLLRDLSEKIDATQRPGDEAEQLSTLASQVSRLNERFESAVPGSAVLDKALQDLFGQLDTVRQSAVTAAENAARELVGQHGAGGEALDSISRDMSTLRQAQRETDHRTQLTLTAVNDALGKIVSRLGQLEAGGKSPAATVPFEPVKLASAAPAKPSLPRAGSDELAASGADRATPLDIPIEPGTGRPGSSSARPATSLDSEAGTDSKADFIAAARRAARAAEEQSASALQAHREAATGTTGRLGGFKAALAARRKPIMLAIIAALVGIAALQAVHVMKSRQDTPQASVSTSQQDAIAAPAVSSADKSSALPEAVAPVDPVTVGSIAMQPSPTVEAPAQAMPLAPDQLQALKPVLASIGSQKLREAALSGEPDALYEAGIRYIDGKGIEADAAAGAKLLEAAARLGSAPSEYRLGSLYREGKGVTADKAKALDWFKQAAEGGNARAMHNAGVLMAEGVDGAPDYAAAADWFRRASELNVRDSQYNLAILYARGLGVKQDLAASYVWFNAAAGQGDADAGKKRDEIAGRMQPGELAAAKATAAAWKAKPLDPRANEVAAPEGGWDVPVKTGAAKQKGGKA